MADRFDDIAFRIVRDNFGEVPRVAAILRAAVELAREGAGERGEGKPVAGEWDAEEEAPSVLCLVDTGVCVANVYAARGGEWEWHVYNADCDRIVKHGSGCQSAKEARAAVVEWAHNHAAELDWRLPESMAQPVAWDGTLCADCDCNHDNRGKWREVGCVCENDNHPWRRRPAEIRARGSEQPAPRSAAPDLTARMAEALREAFDGSGGTGWPAHSMRSRWRALLAEYDAQPAATNTERK